ncbi:phosphopantetheine-binding protein [Streptomyces sp. NPDC086122]
MLDDHPAVRDSVVITVDDASGRASLAAYWVPVPGAGDPGELRETLVAHCAARLPDHMVPSALAPIASVLLNANGKLDRAALPHPDREAPDEAVAPRGVVEERIAEIFEDLLGGPADSHSHFFREGGNSILAIRLIAEIQQTFDIDFPTRAVFEGSTVAELAQVVEAEVRAEIDRMSQEDLETWHPSPAHSAAEDERPLTGPARRSSTRRGRPCAGVEADDDPGPAARRARASDSRVREVSAGAGR